ncbi:cysteine desulfurase family protein [Clostridium celatum]|uniref:cysteine desulfurase family protein n=1 Tax=Clostridium celatum TaxID=36834 RepID=UPI002900862F|nr:cysteine desulfurase family protein [Clostridium celatum]MDU2266187.1 cysteine desulfurase family protein [Clostridium celatum]MDU6296470.1 cysteine desulfurase family protein [Clostridium celatum]
MEIYFDNSATTVPYDEVIEEVSKGMKEYFGNPSSLHKIGMKCEKRLNEAREYFTSTIKCNKDEIYFTSGGSEGNNLILKGLLKPGHHLITTTFEHHSIINTCKELEDRGIKVTYLDVDSEGKISLEDLEEAICKDTVLVSIMYVNNEMGAIQDIEAIGNLIKEKSNRAKLHIDAVQGYGKLPIDVNKSKIDFLTVAGHKIHGPKGVGFVYIKKGIVLNSLISGGEQEKGFRAGTENLPGVIGFEKAAKITFENMDLNYNKVLEVKAYFIERLKEIDNIRINSPLDGFSPYILNVSFLGVRAEVLLHLLEDQGIYVATGSACTSKSSAAHGSYVIKALGLNNREIESAIRFSFSYENTKDDVDYTIDVLKKSLVFLRRVKR